MSWQLRLRTGSGPVEEQTLNDGRYVAGRSDDADIVLKDDQASARHLRIDVSGTRMTVTDLLSKNGTTLDGRPVNGTMDVMPASTITVGKSTMVVDVSPGQGKGHVSSEQGHVSSEQGHGIPVDAEQATEARRGHWVRWLLVLPGALCGYVVVTMPLAMIIGFFDFLGESARATQAVWIVVAPGVFSAFATWIAPWAKRGVALFVAGLWSLVVAAALGSFVVTPEQHYYFSAFGDSMILVLSCLGTWLVVERQPKPKRRGDEPPPGMTAASILSSVFALPFRVTTWVTAIGAYALISAGHAGVMLVQLPLVVLWFETLRRAEDLLRVGRAEGSVAPALNLLSTILLWLFAVGAVFLRMT